MVGHDHRHWRHRRPDADALRAHFSVPAARQFVTELDSLAASASKLEIYEAQRVSI